MKGTTDDRPPGAAPRPHERPVRNLRAAAGIILALHGHLEEAIGLLQHAATINSATLRWARVHANRAAAADNPYAAALLREWDRVEEL